MSKFLVLSLLLLTSCTDYSALGIARRSSDVQLCNSINSYGGSLDQQQAAAERNLDCDKHDLVKLDNKKPQWIYTSKVDPMNDTTSYLSDLSSNNSESLGHDWRDSTRMNIYLSASGQSRSVGLAVQQGLFSCTSYRDCTINIRFDNAKPVAFRARASDDSQLIFLNDYHGFIARMMKAKKMLIEASFYQEGNHVFEFDVQGFDADRYLRKE